MANICQYKMLISGEKAAVHDCCLALGEISSYTDYDEGEFDEENYDEEEYDEENDNEDEDNDEEDEEDEEDEDEDEFEIFVEGECDWGIDAQELSAEYGVKIKCNYLSEDDDFAHYEEYDNGTRGLNFEPPKSLRFGGATQVDPWGEREGLLKCKVMVKGKKSGCYTLYEEFSEQNTIYECGSDEEYELAFEAIDYNGESFNCKSLSLLYDIEIMVNQRDMYWDSDSEDYEEEDGYLEFVHYKDNNIISCWYFDEGKYLMDGCNYNSDECDDECNNCKEYIDCKNAIKILKLEED